MKEKIEFLIWKSFHLREIQKRKPMKNLHVFWKCRAGNFDWVLKCQQRRAQIMLYQKFIHYKAHIYSKILKFVESSRKKIFSFIWFYLFKHFCMMCGTVKYIWWFECLWSPQKHTVSIYKYTIWTSYVPF